MGSLSAQTSGLSSGTNFTNQGSVTVTFTPPTSLGPQFPNSTSTACTITCYTYNASGTLIGTTTKDLTLNIPSYTPTGSISLTGVNLLSGAYVENRSSMTVSITAASSYGATIKSYSTVVDGKTYTTQSFTTSVLSTGSKTATTTITDSRGKTVTVNSSSITVYAYAIPYITTFTLTRQSTATTVVAAIKGGFSSVNSKNAKTVKVTLNGVTNTVTLSAYTFDTTTTFTGVPTDSTLTGKLTLTDSYTTVTKDAVLPTVAVTMDFYKDGKGIAMGKVAETTDLFEVAWKTKHNKAVEIKDDALATLTLKRNHTLNGASVKFQNDTEVLGYVGMYGSAVDRPLRRWTSDASTNYIILDTGNLNDYIKDYVIEQGTSNGWEYTKWNSGKIELFSERSLSFSDGTKQTENLYRSIVSLDLSGLLIDIMSGTCAVQTNGMVPLVCRHSETHTIAEIVIVTSRTFSTFTITAPIYIIGKWK